MNLLKNSYLCTKKLLLVLVCMHAATNLADDVSRSSPLDTSSDFPYENFFRHIKAAVHASNSPLEQLSNTYSSMLHYGLRFVFTLSCFPKGSSKLHN